MNDDENSGAESGEAGERDAPHQDDARAFPIVAVGASAGGLKACRDFLRALPADAGVAVVTVSHPDPSNPGIRADLLGESTRISVHEARDGDRLAPGHVHVIPPGVFLRVEAGRLRLDRPQQGELIRRPLDMFLRSLARDAGQRANCVILSGRGDDGSEGLLHVHAAGGLVLVQDPTRRSSPTCRRRPSPRGWSMR